MIAKLLLTIFITSFSPNHSFSHFDISQNGGLLLSVNGDIWLFEPDDSNNPVNGNWTQLTMDIASNRDPVWKNENETIIFASDRKGNYDLWELNLKTKKLTQITHSPLHELQPDISSNGTLVWVKGIGPDADIWIKRKDEAPKPLTSKLGEDHSPSFSPNGKEIAYISNQNGIPRLEILNLASGKTQWVIRDKEAEYPAWSPDGNRLLFSVRGRNQGIFITDREGKYQNLISNKRGRGIWGENALIVSELPRNPPSYNGDPSPDMPRLDNIQRPTFFTLPIPKAPDETLQKSNSPGPYFSNESGLQQFDKVANYIEERYDLNEGEYSKEWKKLRLQSRKTIETADTKDEIETAIYQLIKERPHLNPEPKGKSGVSSAHPLATQAGVEILEKGGNVVDAAIAVSFALGVVEPDASGIGGYGEMLIYLKEMEAPTCIEFLTRVPEAGSLDNGKLQNLPDYGPKLVNIPGTVAGMELAWKKYGSKLVSWKEIVSPAQKLAEKGFVLDHSFTTTLRREKEKYLQYESNKALFFRNGEPLSVGDTLTNPDLAWVLKTIAEKGGQAFYKGEIARKMVSDLNSHGNVMTLNDMARYYAVERKPVETTYRGHTVYSGPPPVSGGASLIGKLNLLEQYANPGLFQDDVTTAHAMIEAWKMSPSGWGNIADPGLWPVNMEPFTDKEKAKAEWQNCFNENESISSENKSCYDELFTAADIDREGIDKKTLTGTTAFVVADGEGNMVSVTQTLGTWGGNFYVSPGLGFLYNDKLHSYSSNPNSFNARIPFARNVTSISPSMVFKGIGQDQKPWFSVGAAGNAWISSAVYEMLAATIDQNLSPQEAIELPRFLVNARRERGKISQIVVQMEDGFAPEVIQKLEAMGHTIQRISRRGELRMGYASMIMIDGKKVKAGADPRRSGKAGVVK